jgi:2-polyprenyl-6-methoxyphenol hydroxylase-like FAD-dependent oxidoreductase
VRTREIFRQWGVEERFLEEGALWQPLTVHSAVPGQRPLLAVDFSDIADEADRPGLLILEQSQVERLLLEAVRGSGLCDLRFAAEAVGLEQDDDRVKLTVRQGGEQRSVQAQFVIGCDGASSFVRGALGLPFDGATYALRPMLADVEVVDERDRLPQPRAWTGEGALAFAARLRPGLWRIVHLPQGAPEKEDVSEDEVRQQVGRLLGPGPFHMVWGSRFRIHVRASPRFRIRRVLLAGDAAHVHSPAGGLGMNGGVQDAQNLAWKLAAALRGGDTDRLLDSYHVERRAVAVEATSRCTDRLTRIFIQSPAMVRNAAWAVFRTMLRVPPLRRMILRRMTMIDLDYPASPLLEQGARARGVRLPNPLLRSPAGAKLRLYDLLPNAPVILDVAAEREFSRDLPLDHVIQIGPGGYTEPKGLLRGLLGHQDGWILVRPDLYVAWAKTSEDGMIHAIEDALGTGR